MTSYFRYLNNKVIIVFSLNFYCCVVVFSFVDFVVSLLFPPVNVAHSYVCMYVPMFLLCRRYFAARYLAELLKCNHTTTTTEKFSALLFVLLSHKKTNNKYYIKLIITLVWFCFFFSRCMFRIS